jgi:hypothetical protein
MVRVGSLGAPSSPAVYNVPEDYWLFSRLLEQRSVPLY